jgi:hypothetical protein
MLMDLDRGTLAKIDRNVLSGLDHDATYRMVRLRVSAATWSTWKRYCDSLGISMGCATVAMIEHELHSVVGQPDAQAVFLAEYEKKTAERESTLDERERKLAEREARLRDNERRIRMAPVVRATPSPAPKIGRNDRCPCGSGLKYKRCHGEYGRTR